MSADKLPRGWARLKLADVAGTAGLMSDGDWIESKDQDPTGDVRLVQLADIGEGVFRNRSARFLTGATASRLGCTFLEAGDVLIARMPDPLGRACIFPGDPKPSVTAVDVCILRPDARAIDHRWLMHTINAPANRLAIEALQSGTTRKRISGANLREVGIRVPPLAEQRRIVDRLDELLSDLDAGVAALERAKVLLGRYRQSVLRAAVTGELTRDWRERHAGQRESGADLLRRILAERRRRWEEAELAKLRAKGKTPRDDSWKRAYREPAAPDTANCPRCRRDGRGAALRH